jgi:hypothetical protein
MKKWPLVACALGFFACGGETRSHPQPAGPATLELGTGSWQFEAIEDGQDVELVHGAQGGWHMWISLKVRNAAVDHATVQLAMQPADESRPREQVMVQLPFDPPDEQGACKLIGYTGIVNDPSCWVGELVRVEATVTTDDGTVLSDEHEVTLRGGVYPPPACASAHEN